MGAPICSWQNFQWLSKLRTEGLAISQPLLRQRHWDTGQRLQNKLGIDEKETTEIKMYFRNSTPTLTQLFDIFR